MKWLYLFASSFFKWTGWLRTCLPIFGWKYIPQLCYKSLKIHNGSGGKMKKLTKLQVNLERVISHSSGDTYNISVAAMKIRGVWVCGKVYDALQGWLNYTRADSIGYRLLYHVSNHSIMSSVYFSNTSTGLGTTLKLFFPLSLLFKKLNNTKPSAVCERQHKAAQV